MTTPKPEQSPSPNHFQSLLEALARFIGRHEILIARTSTYSAVLLLAFMVFMSANWFTDIPNTTVVVETSSATPVAPSNTTIETEVLKAQLATEKAHSERLLGVVLWALGGTAGIAILLVGFSWFSTTKLTEIEKRDMQERLQGFTVRVDSIEEQGQTALAHLKTIFQSVNGANLDMLEQNVWSQLSLGNVGASIQRLRKVDAHLIEDQFASDNYERMEMLLKDIIETAEGLRFKLTDSDAAFLSRKVDSLQGSSEADKQNLLERIDVLKEIDWDDAIDEIRSSES